VTMAPQMLIGCEHSGEVRRAMRSAGLDCWSCDLLPADDGSPHHIVGDVLEVMRSREWAAFGLHPDCTFLTVAGIHWNNRGRGWERTAAALAFVRELIRAAGSVPWYLENPVSIISTQIRKPDQIVQPYEYGEDASKKTYLWLNRLPLLRSRNLEDWAKPRHVCSECGHIYPPGIGDNWRDQTGHVCCNKCGLRMSSRWANQTDSGQNRLPPSADRWKLRSRTYPGIAAAMAAQWAPVIARTFDHGGEFNLSSE
jgi:hypothetical protein